MKEGWGSSTLPHPRSKPSSPMVRPHTLSSKVRSHTIGQVIVDGLVAEIVDQVVAKRGLPPDGLPSPRMLAIREAEAQQEDERSDLSQAIGQELGRLVLEMKRGGLI